MEARTVGTQYPLGIDDLLDPTFLEFRRVCKRRLPDEPDAVGERLAFHCTRIQTYREEIWEEEKELEDREFLSKKKKEILLKGFEAGKIALQKAQEDFWSLNIADPVEREQQKALEALKWASYKETKNLARWNDQKKKKKYQRKIQLAAIRLQEQV